MIGLLQRVSSAGVSVDGTTVAHIGAGLAVLVGVRPEDTPVSAQRLLERLITYRVFADARGRMNLSLVEAGGELLLVPQFTLAADTHQGARPGFSGAAAPALARTLFEHLVSLAFQRVSSPPADAGSVRGLSGVQSGVFGADMKVSLVNDGPVTFWLESTGR
jgi:D-aminoacyl-tRNA deacylase